MNYLIFVGYNHYPSGGADDLKDRASEYKDAIQSLVYQMSKATDGDFNNAWGHIYDILAGEIVYELDKSDFIKIETIKTKIKVNFKEFNGDFGAVKYL